MTGSHEAAEEDSVRGEIGVLPGDEAFLLKSTTGLVEDLMVSFRAITERLFDT